MCFMDLSDNDELALIPSSSDDREMAIQENSDQEMTIEDVLGEKEHIDAFEDQVEEDETDWVSIFQGHLSTQEPEQEVKEKRAEEESFTRGVFSVSCHPKNPMLFATGGADDRAFLVHLEPGLCSVLNEFSEFKDSVTETSWKILTESPLETSFLALGSMDGTCLLIKVNVNSSKVESFFMIEGPTEAITCLVWHPCGPDLLIGSADQTLWLWRINEDFDSNPPECIHVMSLNAPLSKCCFTSDGKYIVAGGEDGMVTLWCPRDGKQLAKYPVQGQESNPVTSMTCHPVGQVLLVGHENGSIRYLKTSTVNSAGSVLEQVHNDSIEQISFCEGKLLLMATACLDGKVIIWDAAALKPRLILDHNQATSNDEDNSVINGVTCMEWLPLGLKLGHLITCTVRGECWLWDARTGTLVRRWSGRRDEAACTALSVSLVAKMFVVGYEDGLVAVYDYE